MFVLIVHYHKPFTANFYEFYLAMIPTFTVFCCIFLWKMRKHEEGNAKMNSFESFKRNPISEN